MTCIDISVGPAVIDFAWSVLCLVTGALLYRAWAKRESRIQRRPRDERGRFVRPGLPPFTASFHTEEKS